MAKQPDGGRRPAGACSPWPPQDERGDPATVRAAGPPRHPGRGPMLGTGLPANSFRGW